MSDATVLCAGSCSEKEDAERLVDLLGPRLYQTFDALHRTVEYHRIQCGGTNADNAVEFALQDFTQAFESLNRARHIYARHIHHTVEQGDPEGGLT